MIIGETIVLRCDHEGCCPTVTKTDKEVILTDDYGGTVRLTLKQAAQLQEVLMSAKVLEQ